MTQKQDDRPTLNLGHLVIPNVSASRDWLRRQGEQRETATEIVANETREWFGDHLPDHVYEQFAQRVVTALDHRV
ncbi:hypothetical protein [Streptomyces sp. NPDC002088]|uniref:hypothetical protein n=1 Tax=Streptomyces sp. NPDC002088 TaxID=3154665 RepID=UPI0033229610